MSNPAFTKIFSPAQFLIGLGVSAAGLLVFAWIVITRHARVSSVAIAGAGVVLGGGLVATCRRDACAACKKTLDVSTTEFPIAADAQVRAAVAALGRGDPSGLLALEPAPYDAFRAPIASEIELWHCTQCLQVGRVHAAKRERSPQGMKRDTEWSPKVDVTGGNVKVVVDVMTRRNEGATRALS